MTETAAVLTPTRPSELEFQKLSRQYKRAEAETIQFCVDFAASWGRLKGQRAEREHLAELFGWQHRYAQQIAQVGRDYPKKKKIIETASPGSHLPVDPKGMLAVVRADEKSIEHLARGGLFSAERSASEIRHAVKTGAVPKLEAERPDPRTEKPRKLTPLDRIKAKVESAEKHISHAHGDIAEVLALMDQHEITSVRGLQVRGLQREFEKLCAHMATANPATYEKAIKILRGQE